MRGISERGWILKDTQHIPGPMGLRCDKCETSAHDQVNYSEYFLNADQYLCKWCSKPLNLFRMFSSAICNEVWPQESYYLVGGRSSVFSIKMEPETIFNLAFSDHDIPEEAIILQVNYTPDSGGLFPVELSGNQRQPQRFLPAKVALYPAPLFQDKESNPGETKVNVLVTWLEPNKADHALTNLFDAFYYLHQGDYVKSIVPANVAVEDPLNKLCTQWLSSQEIGKKTVKEFLENAATYSHQLNVLLQLLAKQVGAPSMNDEHRGSLNRLRGLRNKIAHEGKLPVDLEKTEAAELISASLLGHVYVKWIAQSIR